METELIHTLVLAAGLSTRMGTAKLLLPWGNGSVLSQVVETYLSIPLPVTVVTGGFHQEVEQLLQPYSIRMVFNPLYTNGNMLDSIQTGLRALLDTPAEAVFIALGDQPHITPEPVRALLAFYRARPGGILFPSYQMRRGHPWLISRPFWAEILALKAPQTLRDFTSAHAEEIAYINLDAPEILKDLDTPEDYQRDRPPATK